MEDALKTPKIVFTPKQKMRDAANVVGLSIDKGSVKSSTGAALPPSRTKAKRKIRWAKADIKSGRPFRRLLSTSFN